MKNKKGFTMVELLIVIAIIGILALLVVPKVIDIYKSAKMNSFLIQAKEMYNVANSHYTSKSLTGETVETTLSRAGGSKLLNVEDNIDYFIRLSDNGKIDYLEVSDSNFCIQTTKKANELTEEDIIEGECGDRPVVGKVKYIVKYDSNGGIGTIPDQEFTYTIEGQLTTLEYTRVGYKFNGWSTDKNATTPMYTGGQTVLNLITKYDEVVTLYAVWKAYTYTVTYNANRGSGTMPTTICTYDKDCILSNNLFTRNGYKFIGWNVDSTSSTIKYANSGIVKNLTSTDKANVNLYVVWEITDIENPVCTLTANSSGIYFGSKTDNIGVTEFGLSTTSTPVYNSSTTISLGTGTFYGFVKDAVGNVGSCSINVTNTSGYTCNCHSESYYCGSSSYSCNCHQSCSSYQCNCHQSCSTYQCNCGYHGVDRWSSCSTCSRCSTSCSTCQSCSTSCSTCYSSNYCSRQVCSRCYSCSSGYNKINDSYCYR